MKLIFLIVTVCVAPLVNGCAGTLYLDPVPTDRQDVIVVPAYRPPPIRYERRRHETPGVTISIRRKMPSDRRHRERYYDRGHYDRRSRRDHYEPHYDRRGEYLYHRRPYWWE